MDNEMLRIETAASGRQRLIRLVGEVDLSVSGRLVEALREAIGRPDVAEVDVDLHELRFIDAAGVRALMSAADLATVRGVTLHVSRGRGIVDTVLRVTGVADRLGVPTSAVEDSPATLRDP